MKSLSRPIQPEGSALLLTVISLGVLATAVGVCVAMTTNTARLADRSQDLPILQAAADGALEYAYGMWKGKSGQLGRPLTTSEASANLTAPTFKQVTYKTALSISAADAWGAPVANPSPSLVDVSGFPGWKGKTYNYVASVRVSSDSSLGPQLTYGVKRTFQYITVQLFQAMYFFENDFEMYRPATMIVSGLAHTNRYGQVSNDIVSGYPLTFQNYASHVMGWNNAEPYRSSTWSGYSSNRNQEASYSAGVNEVSRLEPLGAEPSEVLDAAPTSPLSPSGQLIGPDGDSDGNPNNDSFHELIEPPVASAADPAPIANRRLYNKAGIIVTVNGTTKTVTTANGTSLTSSQITAIKNAISTTTIYDQREQANVRVSSLDVSAARSALNSASGFNGVLYMYDTTTTTSSTPLNAIRLKNGGILPDAGLTVASANGIYIQGDYNTGTTTSPTSVPSNNGGNSNNTDSPTVSGYTRKPAAVIGDAVMILSNSWSDSNSSSSLSNRVASNTTINAAFLSGFMPSGYQPGGGASQYGYSGGANNYPRFLENWNGKYCTYFGSMVQLFTSKSFTGRWDTGNIYSPPNRCWNYDTNFDDNPPPGSVDAVFTSRGTWARY